MKRLKVRYEEILIGALLGLGTALAVLSPLILLTHLPMPSLLAMVWPFALLDADPDRWTMLPHAIVSVGGWGGMILGGWLAARQSEEQHVRGARYEADPAAAVQALQAIETARMSAQQKAHAVCGVRIGGVEWSRSRETEHALVLGLPGGGKTAGVLRPLLDQALARGDRVIVHDPKGDFTSENYDPSTTVLLGPWDARAHLWDGAGDMDSPALVDEFAAAICGVAAAGEHKYFNENAATILGGLIKSAQRVGKRWTWAQLADALRHEPVAMIKQAALGDALVQGAIPSLFSAGRGELSPSERSILSTLATSSRMLLQLGAVDQARPDAPRFSLRGWLAGTLHTEIRLVILNSSALYGQACEALWGSMLAVASATMVAGMPNRNADEAGLWLILDEARQLGGGALERIQTIEEVGRSRGVRVVLGLQDAQQLEAAVGREKAGPMLSMQSTRFYLRAAPAAAQQIVHMVGDRDIKRITSTASAGATQGKTSNHERTMVLTTADLTGLRVTRCAEGTVDIEVLVGIEDVLAKLVANSGPRAGEIAEPFVACQAWRAGMPPTSPQHEESQEPETGVSPEMGGSEDVDLPFDWGQE